MESLTDLPVWAQNVFALLVAVGTAFLVLRNYFRGRDEARSYPRSVAMSAIGIGLVEHDDKERYFALLERIARALESLAKSEEAGVSERLDRLTDILNRRE